MTKYTRPRILFSFHTETASAKPGGKGSSRYTCVGRLTTLCCHALHTRVSVNLCQASAIEFVFSFRVKS